MIPQKRKAAATTGIINLGAKIRPLRAKLAALDKAYLKLYHMKWSAEAEMIEVNFIPMGVNKKSLEQEKQSFAKRIKGMSAGEAAELLAILERRLEDETE